jgi:hypothetical protein
MPARALRFAFTRDGRPAEGEAPDMSVTYLGRFNRSQAEADARRRFEEWRQMGNRIAQRWAADQVVVA